MDIRENSPPSRHDDAVPAGRKRWPERMIVPARGPTDLLRGRPAQTNIGR